VPALSLGAVAAGVGNGRPAPPSAWPRATRPACWTASPCGPTLVSSPRGLRCTCAHPGGSSSASRDVGWHRGPGPRTPLR